MFLWLGTQLKHAGNSRNLFIVFPIMLLGIAAFPYSPEDILHCLEI